MKPRTAGIALLAALVVGAAVRLWLAAVDDGIFWPDEIFQSLEPAHRRAFGYALFAVGVRRRRAQLASADAARARSCGSAPPLGGDRPRAYLMIVRVLFVALVGGDGVRRVAAGTTAARPAARGDGGGGAVLRCCRR